MSDPIKVPFLDLSGEFADLKEEWLASIQETGKAGSYILGPNVTAFEQEAADYIGVKHAVAVANGTDALILSLRALGVQAGDGVITSPFTFFATSEAIAIIGATPVFADIEAASFCLDPDSVKQKITAKTKGILAVHIFGHPADMTRLNAIAKEHGLFVVEDAAQAFASKHGDKIAGSLGDTGCFSFYPTKVLGCYGDGGIISTDRDDVEAHLRRLRNHGATAPFMHSELGYNSRLDEIQASLLRIKLSHIDQAIASRQTVAAHYTDRFQDSDVVVPSKPKSGRHAFNLYTIRIPNRDKVRQALTDKQIPSSVCYAKPLHLQEAHRDLGYKVGDLPVCDKAGTEALSLPVYPDLSLAQVDYVADCLLAAL